MSHLIFVPHRPRTESPVFLSNRRFIQWMLPLIALLSTAPGLAAQPDFAPGLCVVDVKNATMAFAEHIAPGFPVAKLEWASLALAHDVRSAPGLPRLILYPRFYSGLALSVSGNGTLEQFVGQFPSSAELIGQDQYAVEPASGRILGANNTGLYDYDRNIGEFRVLTHTEIQAMKSVPRLGVVFAATRAGLSRISRDGMESIPGTSAQEIGWIEVIADLPVHKAVLLSTYRQGPHDHEPQMRQAWLSHDNGSIELLADTSGSLFTRGEQISRAGESRDPGRIMAIAGHRLLDIKMRHGANGFSPEDITTRTGTGDLFFGEHYLITQSGEFLLLGRASWSGRYGLERLASSGLEAVSGGQTIAATALSWMRESVSLGQILIWDQHGLYAYDGTRAMLIPGSAPKTIGEVARPYDLPSIGREIIKTPQGLFQVSVQGLERLQLPFEANFETSVAELPALHVGLIATSDNLYALMPDGTVLPIRSGPSDEYLRGDAFLGLLPDGNAMLVGGKRSLHLVVGSLELQHDRP
jgi:hypothetical protein